MEEHAKGQREQKHMPRFVTQNLWRPSGKEKPACKELGSEWMVMVSDYIHNLKLKMQINVNW